MRPDQHKKKKNSEYKKKHGIPSEKGGKHDKKGSTGAQRSDEKAAPDVSKSGLETDVEESSVSHEGSGKFSRRKIESNLDRYKEDDFDVECEPSSASSSALSSLPIGADFQSLVDNANSANGSSHFRFKNEKEWDNIITDEANSKNGQPSFLSIDCHALAQSLRNIPLEKRLDIDKKYSIEDNYCGSTANKSQQVKLATDNEESTETNSRKLGQNVCMKNTDFNLSQHSKLTKASNETDKYSVGHMLKSPEAEQKIEKHLTDQLEVQSKESNPSEKLQSNGQSIKSKDDFDLLLGIDHKELNTTHTENRGETQSIQASGSANKMDAKTAQKTQPAGDTKENLEDWLDSILD